MYKIIVVLVALATMIGCATFRDNLDHNIERKGNLVVDNSTGLMWMRCPLGQKWKNNQCVGDPIHGDLPALKAKAADFTYNGHGDWRLPTMDELISIVNCSGSKIDNFDSESFRHVSFDGPCNFSIFSDNKLAMEETPFSHLDKQILSSTNYIISNRSHRNTTIDFSGRGTIWSRSPHQGSSGSRKVVTVLVRNMSGEEYSFGITNNTITYAGSRNECDFLFNDKNLANAADINEAKELRFLGVVEKEFDNKNDFIYEFSSGNDTFYIPSDKFGTAGEKREIEMSSDFSEWKDQPDQHSQRCIHPGTISKYNSQIEAIENFFAYVEEKEADIQRKQDLREQRQKEREQKRLERAAVRKREEEARQKKVSERIRKPSPQIGMTKDQVKNDTNWGGPNRVVKYRNVHGTIEYWHYGRYDERVLMFINGILQSTIE